jgi:hypothetical protein
MRGAHSQPLFIERRDDFGRQNRLELLRIRILAPQIPEHVPASPHHLQFFFTAKTPPISSNGPR